MTTLNFKNAAYSQEIDLAVVFLVTITSPTLNDDVRITNVPFQKFEDLGENVYGCMSRNKKYIFIPFQLSLPNKTKEGFTSGKITIDNVNREVLRYAREATQPLNVKIECVLSNDLNEVETSLSNFKLTNIEYDTLTITGDLSIDYLGLEPFPCGRFTPSDFPGLF